MIETFAIDIYKWILTTDLWVHLASYLFVFSMLFNATNTLIILFAHQIHWFGWSLDNVEFIYRLKEYNSLYAKSITILAVIGTFLGLSMAFDTLGSDTSLPEDSIQNMLSEIQYVFVSSLFGYFLGAFYSGILVDFLFRKFIKNISADSAKEYVSTKVDSITRKANDPSFEFLKHIKLLPCKANQNIQTHE